MSVLEVRCDLATIVVDRELKTYIDQPGGGSLLVKDALAFKILEKLGLQRKSVWNGQDIEAEDGSIYFKVKKERLEVQTKGTLYVSGLDGQKSLNTILEVIREEKLTYRFTRFDLLYLTRENLFLSLKKSDFKNLTKTTREQRQDPFWFNAFSTVFGVVFYDKIKQLKKIKKKNPEYFKRYEEKFGLEEPLYHFELRQLLFRRKDRKTNITTELVPSASIYPFNFDRVRAEIEENILGRVKFHKTIKNLIKEARK